MSYRPTWHTDRKMTLQRVSVKISDALFLRTTPPILPTPPFLWENFEPPLLRKILNPTFFSLTLGFQLYRWSYEVIFRDLNSHAIIVFWDDLFSAPPTLTNLFVSLALVMNVFESFLKNQHFSTWNIPSVFRDSIVGTPSLPLPATPLYKGGEGVWVFKFFEKKGGSDFSHKKGRVGKIGAGISLIFIKTNLPSVIFLWVFAVCVLFIYIISISITTVS